ncbi:MAG TPA: ferric reductase-like transmembrane domain-containing protein [Solirubrobacteraceae bacterium]|nr:ferric reductase-like transmembrane domain-containing protein [Solirubrobacteraceae bacterium]
MIGAAGPSALWYLTRGTGLVTLLLLTASVVLGILQVRRWTPAGSPRFVVVSLHRAVSLLVVALLAVHVLTAVLDSFAPISLVDAVVPFAGRYRPLWLGLGALALDLLVALTVTSLLRRRLGLGAWRAVHWLAYVCWPVALLHGWGTGTDTRSTVMLVITVACAAGVLGAITWRVAGTGAQTRAMAFTACAVLSAIATVWLALGPLADGWARRSGTPAELLASTTPRTSEGTRSALERTFSAGLTGTVRRGTTTGGLAVVDLRMRLTGGPSGLLTVRVAGEPAAGGGVVMRRSAVTLEPPGSAGGFEGRISALDGSSLEALLRSASGRAVRLRIDLTLSGDEVGGTVSGTPVTESSG